MKLTPLAMGQKFLKSKSPGINDERDYDLSDYALLFESAMENVYRYGAACYSELLNEDEDEWDEEGDTKGPTIKQSRMLAVIVWNKGNSRIVWRDIRGGYHPIALKYIYWLINISPFKDCILSKDVNYAWEYGMVFNPEFPSNYVVGAMTAFRMGYEYDNIVRTWYALVSIGVDPTWAFYLASCAISFDNSVFSQSYRMADGHEVLDGKVMDKIAVKNFLTGIVRSPSSYIFSECTSYKKGGSINGLWGCMKSVTYRLPESPISASAPSKNTWGGKKSTITSFDIEDSVLLSAWLETVRKDVLDA